MNTRQKKEEESGKAPERAPKKRKNRVTLVDKLVSGGVVISFIGVLSFAALLFVMLVIKI